MWWRPASDDGSISTLRALGVTLPLIVTVATLLAATLVILWPLAPTATHVCRDSGVAMSSGQATGDARLCTDSAAVHLSMSLRGLMAGVRYMGWFLYFARPSLCETSLCGIADVWGRHSPGVSIPMGETIADNIGAVHLSSSIEGMHLSPTSQVTLMAVDLTVTLPGHDRDRTSGQLPDLHTPVGHFAPHAIVGTALFAQDWPRRQRGRD